MEQFTEFKCIKLIKNSKNPAVRWKNTENQIIGLEVENYKCGKEFSNHYNVAVLTGKKNNITVVDIDYHKFKEDSRFVKELGGIDYIKSLDTFIVKTPSGGFHIYYEYDQDIYTTQNSEHQVDIRNDGAYIVKFGSIRDNKFYSVIKNKPISKIPDNLKEWLITNITPPKTNKNTDPEGNTVKHLLEKINYPQDFIDDIKTELKKTKINLFKDAYGFLKFTNGMKHLGLFEEWDEYNKTQEKYNYNNNLKYWNTADTDHFNFVNWICVKLELSDYLLYKPLLKNTIEPLRQFYSPKLDYDFIEYLDNEFDEYEEVKKKTKKKELVKIGDNFYPQYEEVFEKVLKSKSYVIKSDTGTGKTTCFKHFVKNTKQKFISIVSRISLGEAQYQTFSEESIDCKFYQYEDNFNNKDNIIIQLDSIKKLFSIDFSDYVIFLDEFNSIIEYLISSDTLQNIRILVFLKLKEIIKSCKKVICVDADISDVSLKFLNYTKINYVFLQNTYKHNKGVKAEEIFDTELFFDELKAEKKFLCCCDSKKEAEILHEKLDKEGIKSCLITSDLDCELPNLDKEDRVIFSPKIVYGVDSVVKRPVFAYYTTKTINPKSMVQQIARCRNITTLKFLFKKKEYRGNEETFEEHTKNMLETNIYSNLEFKALADEETYNQFFDILVFYEYNQKSYKTNPFSHFLNLIDERGFVRDKSIKNITVNKSDKEVKEAILQKKYDNFKLEDYDNINKILRLSEEVAQENIELFVDKYKLMKHFNLTNFVNTEEEKIKKNLLERADFNIVKIKSDKSKIVYLKKVKKLFNNEDININSQPVSKEVSNKINVEYNHYFDKLTKKVDYTDKYECDKLQARIYRSLFPDSLLKTEKIKKCGSERDKTKYTINEEILEHTERLYNIRNPTKNLDFIDT
jgi:hypothetical protein